MNELLATVEELGECTFEHCGDANIPVDIWISRITEDDGYDKSELSDEHKWRLIASNYMPRKCRVSQEVYNVVAPTREALEALLNEQVLPLYFTAMTGIMQMIHGSHDHLYYWQKTEPSKTENVRDNPVPWKEPILGG